MTFHFKTDVQIARELAAWQIGTDIHRFMAPVTTHAADSTPGAGFRNAQRRQSARMGTGQLPGRKMT
jgi:hypothetical protein